MKLFKELVAAENRHQLVLTIVLLCYIILDIQTPKMLANIADNVVGQGIVIILALSLFSTSNKILELGFASNKGRKNRGDLTPWLLFGRTPPGTPN